MTNRHVQLEGPVNFRDLGGYDTLDGGRVRPGRLFRSDSLHTVTRADLDILRDLGIRAAIDFRANDEIEELGIGPIGAVSVRHVHCPTFDRTRGTGRLLEGRTAAELYLAMLERGAGSYVAAANTIAEAANLPAVFFCLAGKDRTGCFAAVVLGLLGVSDADVVADYTLTQLSVPTITARRIERDGAEVEARRWTNIPPELRDARTHVMEELVALVHTRWGGWEGYAASVGIADDVVARLRAELVEPAAPSR